jgi:C-terminal processing protease CtpA/Prc
MKQYHKRFYLYGKTVPELLDRINEFTKQYSVGNIFDVSITEVLEKEIEIHTNYENEKEIDNFSINGSSDNNRIKTTIFKYSYYAIVLILIEE